MNSRLRIGILSGVAAVAVAIAGCGGDDDTTTDSGASGATGAGGTALTEDEFVDQANAICADANEQVAALDPPTGDVQGLGDYAQEVVDISEPLIEQMDALVPPEDLQADFDAYVESVRDQSDLAQQLAEAADAGDSQEVQSLAQQLQETDNDPQAEALGLTECAEDPTPES